MRPVRVFSLMLAMALLGSAAIGRAQFIPGMPSVMGAGGELPPLQPFTGDLKTLTGSMPTVAFVRGLYTMTAHESKTPIETITVRDFTSVASLRLANDGSYELMYRASWGPARLPTDPRFNGVEILEQGRFSLSRAVLLLEPERTTSTRTKNGAAGLQVTERSERRAYVARVATMTRGMRTLTQSLTLIGRCPRYQLDSACQHGMTVQYLFTPSGTIFRKE